jgi:predicted nucleic acid-binding protein
MLDTGPLAKLAHPRLYSDISGWVKAHAFAGIRVIIPEIADYEVRRELLRAGKTESVTRLDQLRDWMLYQPLDTPTMRRAAELWAEARRKGRPTADAKELDGDVILAAQAQQAGAIVATENVGHLSLFVRAVDWTSL